MQCRPWSRLSIYLLRKGIKLCMYLFMLCLCLGKSINACHYTQDYKSENLQYNMVGRWVDGMIVPPSDGPMFILIDWE